MATYRNAGLLTSPNINNNNNNNINNNNNTVSSLNRDPVDYSSAKYNQKQNYKSLTMPKGHYQNVTTPKEFLPAEHDTNYLTASSSIDSESSSNLNESNKRINNPNGKFSIQKIFSKGLSWRTRKKPPVNATPPPPPPSITSTNSAYTNPSTSAPIQSSSSIGTYVTKKEDDDLSKVSPPTAVRSVSVDSISNNTSPQKIIVTEPVNISTIRANSVDSVTLDFDRPPTATRTYMPTSWTNAPTSTTTTTNITTIPTNTMPVTTESTTRLTPIPATRILPVQFTENIKGPAPRSPAPLPPSVPSVVVSSLPLAPAPTPPSKPLSSTSTAKPIEINNNTSSSTKIISNSTKIPPPGKIH